MGRVSISSLQEHSTTFEKTLPLGSTEDFTSLSKTCSRDRPRPHVYLFTMDTKDVESFPTRTLSGTGSVSTANVGRDALADVTPPHDSYEGKHRFDPTAKWTDVEERRVVRKTDMYLLSILCVMFFGLQLDRGNLSNALADNLLKDLKLSTDDYNNGTTIQLLCFLAAEFPVQLLIKRFGFKYILPTMMFAWGTVSWAQAWMTGRTSFYITRAFIGLCEGGFIRE